MRSFKHAPAQTMAVFAILSKIFDLFEGAFIRTICALRFLYADFFYSQYSHQHGHPNDESTPPVNTDPLHTKAEVEASVVALVRSHCVAPLFGAVETNRAVDFFVSKCALHDHPLDTSRPYVMLSCGTVTRHGVGINS